MRWTLLAACAAVVAGLWLPGEAAQPAPSAATAGAGGGDGITFEQYRDWRVDYIERRRSQLASRLKEGDLTPDHKARLERIKAYYDWYAGLAATERDSRFRRRFDRIDTNHDGTMDAAERAAWRKKRRAFYRHKWTSSPSRAEAAAAAH